MCQLGGGKERKRRGIVTRTFDGNIWIKTSAIKTHSLRAAFFQFFFTNKKTLEKSLRHRRRNKTPVNIIHQSEFTKARRWKMSFQIGIRNQDIGG